MSYDVCVFFGEENIGDLSVAIELTERLAGVKFPGAERNEAKLLDVSLEVHLRRPFLKDTTEMPFSNFKYQLEMSCSVAKGELIHPLGFYLARRYSAELGQQAMLCLAGVE